MRWIPAVAIGFALLTAGCGPTRRPPEDARARTYGTVIFGTYAASALDLSAADSFPELPGTALPAVVQDSARGYLARFRRQEVPEAVLADLSAATRDSVRAYVSATSNPPRCARYAQVAELFVVIARASCGPMDDGLALRVWTATGERVVDLHGRGVQIAFVPAFRDTTGAPWTPPVW